MSPNDKPGPSVSAIPDGDNRERLVCPDCGYVAYENPKIVVGAVCAWRGRILLCRRAIAPRIGFWTMPAGYLELGETAADGAKREVWEEAGARVEIDDLLGLYDIPRIGQVYVIYRARLSVPDLAPGPESQEAALFDWPSIPWDHLAFPSVGWALRQYRTVPPDRHASAGYSRPRLP